MIGPALALIALALAAGFLCGRRYERWLRARRYLKWLERISYRYAVRQPSLRLVKPHDDSAA